MWRAITAAVAAAVINPPISKATAATAAATAASADCGVRGCGRGRGGGGGGRAAAVVDVCAGAASPVSGADGSRASGSRPLHPAVPKAVAASAFTAGDAPAPLLVDGPDRVVAAGAAAGSDVAAAAAAAAEGNLPVLDILSRALPLGLTGLSTREWVSTAGRLDLLEVIGDLIYSGAGVLTLNVQYGHVTGCDVRVWDILVLCVEYLNFALASPCHLL